MTDDVGRVEPQGTGTPTTIPGPIFAAAVDTFVAGQRLDVRSLARRVGVARATSYRRRAPAAVRRHDHRISAMPLSTGGSP